MKEPGPVSALTACVPWNRRGDHFRNTGADELIRGEVLITDKYLMCSLLGFCILIEVIP
jgi:hypothetical protein